MRKIELEESKKVELEILKDVAGFCEAHGLKYFLAYGTLIGAVRHKGFIPWDDDIDIQMPRADYEKFLELYNKEKATDYYYAISPYDELAKHSFVKVIDTRTAKIEQGIKYDGDKYLGVDIDIFPLDGQPEDEEEYKKYYNKKMKVYRIFNAKICKYSWKGIIVRGWRKILAACTTKEKLLKKIEKINAKYKYEDCAVVGSTDSLYNLIKDRMKKEYYREYVQLDFEDSKFRAPIDYHEVLTKIYGNYMQLPPVEKRITHHSNVVYWK